MSTIKIKNSKQAIEQHTKSSSRKSAKRRITSDDEDSAVDTSPTPNSPTAKPPAKKLRRTTENVESEDDIPAPLTRAAKHNLPKSRSGKGHLKKNRRILSDDEDDEFFPTLEERPSIVVARATKKDVKGKGKINTGAGQIIAKNESKPPAIHRVSLGTVTDGKKPSRDEGQNEMDVDITSVPESHALLLPAPAVPAVELEPQKKKLPPIKKKPKVGSANTSSVASPSAGTGSKPSNNVVKPVKTPTATSLNSSAIPATILNPSGTGDFDLRDSSTWQSLIGKGSSSSGPRVGVEKRVSTEERRKQLDTLRDEARAQRIEQFRHTFDLQAQSQKINRFEKTFSAHAIRMGGPNVLGAAFRARPLASRSQGGKTS